MNVLVLATGSVSVKLLSKLLKKLEMNGHDLKFIISEKGQILLDSLHHWHHLKSEDVVDLGNWRKDQDFSDMTDFKEEAEKYAKDLALNKSSIMHVELAQWADVILIAPATANTIAKMNYGVCDNILMDTLLVASGLKKKIIIAPAMNSNMWEAWQTQRNIESLKAAGVQFVYPTVKKLACGDYGIGGLADIQSIADKVAGYRWKFPLDTYFNNRFIPVWPHLGGFGAVRKHEIHNGVDIYCENGVKVYAMEDGEVVEVGQFTGEKVGSPWWNDTEYLIVKGHSGYITYGEIKVASDNIMKVRLLKIGMKIKKGDHIGNVVPVLKEGKVRRDIKGHSRFMLHVELKTSLDHTAGWQLNTERPKNLLDPTAYLI